ncbi:hypothetical protein [Flectobacillus major]|uniref:hypothetical protein n=1 Tax=Flectobacillus major TaxID=103 RepID=UPI0005C6B6A9|nr:hypothetical protein [Flectobacillus major]
MTNTIAQRFENLISTLELDSNSFAKSIYANPMEIKKIINHKGKPSFDILTNILSKYPRVSAEWLLRGEGDIYRNKALEDYKGHLEELRYTIEIQKQLLDSYDFPTPVA